MGAGQSADVIADIIAERTRGSMMILRIYKPWPITASLFQGAMATKSVRLCGGRWRAVRGVQRRVSGEKSCVSFVADTSADLPAHHNTLRQKTRHSMSTV